MDDFPALPKDSPNKEVGFLLLASAAPARRARPVATVPVK